MTRKLTEAVKAEIAQKMAARRAFLRKHSLKALIQEYGVTKSTLYDIDRKATAGKKVQR